MLMSHPSRVRGLKPDEAFFPSEDDVAPFAGAWIETAVNAITTLACSVAPFAGAWIETYAYVDVYDGATRRTLRGCVD